MSKNANLTLTESDLAEVAGGLPISAFAVAMVQKFLSQNDDQGGGQGGQNGQDPAQMFQQILQQLAQQQ